MLLLLSLLFFFQCFPSISSIVAARLPLCSIHSIRSTEGRIIYATFLLVSAPALVQLPRERPQTDLAATAELRSASELPVVSCECRQPATCINVGCLIEPCCHPRGAPPSPAAFRPWCSLPRLPATAMSKQTLEDLLRNDDSDDSDGDARSLGAPGVGLGLASTRLSVDQILKGHDDSGSDDDDLNGLIAAHSKWRPAIAQQHAASASAAATSRTANITPHASSTQAKPSAAAASSSTAAAQGAPASAKAPQSASRSHADDDDEVAVHLFKRYKSFTL